MTDALGASEGREAEFYDPQVGNVCQVGMVPQPQSPHLDRELAHPPLEGVTPETFDPRV